MLQIRKTKTCSSRSHKMCMQQVTEDVQQVTEDVQNSLQILLHDNADPKDEDKEICLQMLFRYERRRLAASGHSGSCEKMLADIVAKSCRFDPLEVLGQLGSRPCLYLDLFSGT